VGAYETEGLAANPGWAVAGGFKNADAGVIDTEDAGVEDAAEIRPDAAADGGVPDAAGDVQDEGEGEEGGGGCGCRMI
jgi:hypothetical protein